MKKIRLERFVRNKYFLGKLLTVKDFEIEQNHTIQKRRMLNQMLWGFGILKGLEVRIEDHRNVVISPGIAIDAEGNEIVISETHTVNLSTLSGFDQCKHLENCYLCLAFDAFESEQVSALTHDVSKKNKVQFNRIIEGYALVLICDQITVESQNVVCLGALSLTAVEDSYDINTFKPDPLNHKIYPSVRSGAFELNLDGVVKVSDPLRHGLGNEAVAIKVAIEASIDSKGQRVVFSGEAGLFDGIEAIKVPRRYTFGVMQYEGNGTFRVAVKCHDSAAHKVKIRWWAYRDSDEFEIESK